MIVPSGSDDTLINTVFLSVLDGLKRRLSEDGLDLAIFLEGEKDGRLASLRRVTERGLADALIIADTQRADPRVEYLTKLRRPFVTFGRTKAAARHAWVDPDFEAAVEGAVAHLAGLGHRRIGLALPEVDTNYVDLVERGYRRAMRAHGIVIEEGWDVRRPAGERGGVEAADALLAAAPRTDGDRPHQLDARGGALSPAQRGRSAAGPRHLHPRAAAGGAGAISHSDADELSNRLDRDRPTSRRGGDCGNRADVGQTRRADAADKATPEPAAIQDGGCLHPGESVARLDAK